MIIEQQLVLSFTDATAAINSIAEWPKLNSPPTKNVAGGALADPGVWKEAAGWAGWHWQCLLTVRSAQQTSIGTSHWPVHHC